MAWHSAVINQIPELPNVKIHGVEMLNAPDQLFRKHLQRIEDGGQVHPGRGDRVVDELGVLEEHIGLSQKQSQTDAEYIQLQQDKGEQQGIPGDPGAGGDQHDHQGPQGKDQIHQAAGDFGNGKNVFGNIGFFSSAAFPLTEKMA